MRLPDALRFRASKNRRSPARGSIRALQNIAIESQRSKLPQMAAALSYRTVFGLLPMVIVGLVALRLFVSDTQIDQFFNQALSYFGLEAIVVDPPPVFDPDNPDADPYTGFVTQQFGAPDAGGVGNLSGTLHSLIERAKTIDYRAIGGIAAITLIYAAISMLVEIERAFNQIFRVPIGKPWRRRVLEYWALLTLGTPCLVATFFVGERAKSIVASAVESTGFSSSGVVGVIVSGYAITVAISTALLFLVYTVLPNTRVRFVPALAGALLAAILWEAGKWGFTQYLHYSTGYAKLYGSIALIPLALLWIYATWIIVLMGLQVAHHIQLKRAGVDPATQQPIDWSNPPSGVVDPATAVAVAHVAARSFRDGRPASLTSLVEAVRAQGSVVADVVSRLVDAGVLHRVSVADDANYVTLAQPPEQLRVRTLLELGYDLTDAPDSGPAPGVRDHLRAAHLQAAGNETIADLLTSYPGPPLAPHPATNKSQPETLAPPPANLYPADAPADTLPLRTEGGPDREQAPGQNGIERGNPPLPAADPPRVL